MRQGHMYRAYLDPSVDTEQAARYPVVIVLGNTVNKFAPNVVVCPMTTAIKNYYGDVIIKPSENNGLKADEWKISITDFWGYVGQKVARTLYRQSQ